MALLRQIQLDLRNEIVRVLVACVKFAKVIPPSRLPKWTKTLRPNLINGPIYCVVYEHTVLHNLILSSLRYCCKYVVSLQKFSALDLRDARFQGSQIWHVWTVVASVTRAVGRLQTQLFVSVSGLRACFQFHIPRLHMIYFTVFWVRFIFNYFNSIFSTTLFVYCKVDKVLVLSWIFTLRNPLNPVYILRN